MGCYGSIGKSAAFMYTNARPANTLSDMFRRVSVWMDAYYTALLTRGVTAGDMHTLRHSLPRCDFARRAKGEGHLPGGRVKVDVHFG